MPGALAVILANPTYRGLIAHCGKTYPGRHEAIVDEELWNAVQAHRRSIKAPLKRMRQHIDTPLLAGRLQDDAGNTMRVCHASKGKRRYRYYVSAAVLDGDGTPGSLPRISAGVLDRVVLDMAAPLLASHWRNSENSPSRIDSALIRVEVSATKLRLTLKSNAVDECAASDTTLNPIRTGDEIMFEQSMALARPRNATTIIGGEHKHNRIDRKLVRAIALARSWADKLESGAVRSVVDLAAAQKRCIHYTNRLLPLAYLAPDLVEMIRAGRQPRTLTVSALTAKPSAAGLERPARRFPRLRLRPVGLRRRAVILRTELRASGAQQTPQNSYFSNALRDTRAQTRKAPLFIRVFHCLCMHCGLISRHSSAACNTS
ncbi:MAG: hypothetical protein BroJett013_18170 [Alphaproteobacteria bacterium]|nr:MAG: hypothetical protein BroJett013_18170 [Alphaproteobacteria bacterium]